jgi:hypothetical protein
MNVLAVAARSVPIFRITELQLLGYVAVQFATCLLAGGSLCGLFFDPEDEGDMFRRNNC